MRLSTNFTKTRKTMPSDEEAKNAQLLIRAGYIHKEMAGVYAYLPLGLEVIKNITQIVREEMNAIGGQEVAMTALQPKDVWMETGRWEDKEIDVWFKTQLQNGNEIGLGVTHEEPFIDVVRQYVESYKDLPKLIYQFQTKFRNELRAKSGIMRGREFLMKDLYSFTSSDEEHQKIYEQVRQAYDKVFERIGIGDKTWYTFASGGFFTDFSHEFQTICDAGEDTIYTSKDKKLAVNKEVLNDKVLKELGLIKEELEEQKAAEVGNIFDFGTGYTKTMNMTFKDSDGKDQAVHLGSYGIGISRVMGVVAEIFSDDKGLIWPESIAPAKFHLVSIGDVSKQAHEVYSKLEEMGHKVIYDDRDLQAGEKLADADLLGIPTRLVISQKSLDEGGIEVKRRDSDEAKIQDLDLSWV